VNRKLLTAITAGSFAGALVLTLIGFGCAKGGLNVNVPGGASLPSVNKPNVNTPSTGSLDSLDDLGGGLEKMAEGFKDIPPQDEYGYGVAICAATFGRAETPLLKDEALNAYVAQVGQVLAAVSNRPDLYHGYTFGVIRSSQVNAFAAPGGFILITTGVIAQCRNEDELAAILAHEIAHIELGHPSDALREAKKTAGLAAIAKSGSSAAGVSVGVPGVADVGKVIDGLGDLYGKGYDRGLEDKADRRAVVLLARAGYDPNAMVTMLERMAGSSKPELFSSHYKPEKRAESVKAAIKKAGKAGPLPSLDPAREARFQANAKVPS
jgi:predicted Zn-dependent protease